MLKILQEYIKSLGSVAVAFSGGVDSTLLLKVSHDVLGDKAIAATITSSFTAKSEINEAKAFCEKNGIKQIIIPVDERKIYGFTKNPPVRCYLCKRAIFTQILQAAHENGISTVIDGSNPDDLTDYRPGIKALEELGIISPLRVCNITKSEIRKMSRALGLPTWDKPSFACLASRFVYGEEITREKLNMVEQAENLLGELGFVQFRVRIHGSIARIEILPEDFTKIIQADIRSKIYDDLKKLGFSYVTLDLKGYRTGSMNETINNEAINQEALK